MGASSWERLATGQHEQVPPLSPSHTPPLSDPSPHVSQLSELCGLNLDKGCIHQPDGAVAVD